MQTTVRSPKSPPQMKTTFAALSERRRTRFADNPFAVGEWHIKIGHDRSVSFYCDARLPG